jgi:hypothetical protein
MRNPDVGWNAAGYATIVGALVVLFFIGGVVEVVHFISNFVVFGVVLALLRGPVTQRLNKKQPETERSQVTADKNLPWYIAAVLSFIVVLSAPAGSSNSQSNPDVTNPVTPQQVRRHSQGFSYLADSSWIQTDQADEGEFMQASADTSYAIHLFDGKACRNTQPEQDLACYKSLLQSTYATMSDSPELLDAEIVELGKGTVYAITYYLPGLQAEGEKFNASSLTVYFPLTEKTFVAKCWAMGQRGISNQKRERVFQLVESMVEE